MKLKLEKQEAEALYRIIAGLSRSSYERAEVYDTAKPEMEKVFEKILKYGHDNKVNLRG